MSDEKPTWKFDPATGMIVFSHLLSEEDLQRLRPIIREELNTARQHQHKTSMRRFTFPWGDSHVEGVAFSHASHPGLVAYVNGGIYDFCGSIHVMCAKLNILESDIVWIDEVTV